MDYYPVELNANLTNWRIFSQRKRDSKFQKLQQSVWQRDDYVCQFCGFQATDYQEVVNLDHNYRNNNRDNLVTACCFCTQCFFIESVGKGDFGGGTIIYLPEMTQGELNSFCHVLFCAIANNTGYKSDSQALYRTFRLRSQAVTNKLGESASDPAIFGRLIIETNAMRKPSFRALLKDLRLLPSRSKFKKQIERWAQAALGEAE